MIIRMQDAKEILFCSRGIRAFFTKYKLDYTSFIKNGIDSEELLALNDSMANQVVEHASGKVK